MHFWQNTRMHQQTLPHDVQHCAVDLQLLFAKL
jgi:hypothetical protein